MCKFQITKGQEKLLFGRFLEFGDVNNIVSLRTPFASAFGKNGTENQFVIIIFSSEPHESEIAIQKLLSMKFYAAS